MSETQKALHQSLAIRKVVNKFRKIFQHLGPGFITGAADGDPSGIATFSQAGARYGLQLLWLAPFVFPLMLCIQEMSARIGLVTHRGIIRIIKEEYSPLALWLVGLITIPAIIINIGANLLAMGEAFHLLVPEVSSGLFSILASLLVIISLILFPYAQTTNALKWGACVLIVYLLVPFFVQQDWWLVLRSVTLPHVEFNRQFIITVGSFLGTNISAYLFFWESSMEVDHAEHTYGRLYENPQMEISNLRHQVKLMQKDNAFGMGIAVTIMFFVVWACGSTLYPQGITNITTLAQAAQALQPIAGEWAYLLFVIGIMASGFIAVPVLAGTCGYIVAEAFGHPRGINLKLYEAKVFYLTIFLSLLLSLSLDFINIGAMQALIFATFVYAITVPPSIWYILKIGNNSRIMGKFTNNTWSNLIGYFTFGLMCLVAVCLTWITFFAPLS